MKLISVQISSTAEEKDIYILVIFNIQESRFI